MERLGHSSITVTLNTYGHLFPGLDEALTDGLEEQFQRAVSRAPRPPQLLANAFSVKLHYFRGIGKGRGGLGRGGHSIISGMGGIGSKL